MLGHILVMRKEQNRNEKDYGLLLLRFLKHYGSPHNLNESTTINIFEAFISFDSARLVKCCQLAFLRAYEVLMGSMRGDLSSRSLLGTVLDTGYLVKLRMLRSMQCGHIPAMNSKSRESIAREILTHFQRRSQSLDRVTLDDVKRLNPCLFARLCSFIKPADALISTPPGEQSQKQHFKITSNGRKTPNNNATEKAKARKVPPRKYDFHVWKQKAKGR